MLWTSAVALTALMKTLKIKEWKCWVTAIKVTYRARMIIRHKDSSSLLPVEKKDALGRNVTALTKKCQCQLMVGNHFMLTKKHMEKEESELRKTRHC